MKIFPSSELSIQSTTQKILTTISKLFTGKSVLGALPVRCIRMYTAIGAKWTVKATSHISYDQRQQRWFFTVEACSFIQRITGSIPVQWCVSWVPFGAVMEYYITGAHAY